MDDLRSRAKDFLARPYPLSGGTAENLTDGLIGRYASGGPWDDPELRDLLRLCYFTAETEAEYSTGDARAYFGECAAILRGILVEVFGPEAAE